LKVEGYETKSNPGSSPKVLEPPKKLIPCTDIVASVVSTTLQSGFAQGALQFIACA